MKVKLADGDPTATQQALDPLLTQLHLDDNLRRLVTMEGYIADEIAAVQQGRLSVIITGTALVVALLTLIAQGLTIVFERYSRRVVVRKLFRLGFFARYREYLVVVAALWAAQLVVAIGANAAGASPFTTATSASIAPLTTLLAVAAAVLTLTAELLFSMVVLGFIERRNTVAVLKGDF